MDKLTITAMWDPEANVWVAESEDIGIATKRPASTRSWPSFPQ
jgi:hypothetical protein